MRGGSEGWRCKSGVTGGRTVVLMKNGPSLTLEEEVCGARVVPMTVTKDAMYCTVKDSVSRMFSERVQGCCR